MTAPSPVRFRPLAEPDLPRLRDWLARPHVREWWAADDGNTLDDVRVKYLPRIAGASPVRCFIAEQAGEPFGFIQSYVAIACGEGWWPDETDPGVVGIDQFIADENRLGLGLGTRMVAAFVARLFTDPAVSCVQTDPHPRNLRAIRCYERAGFRCAGEITTPNGPALLMTLRR